MLKKLIQNYQFQGLKGIKNAFQNKLFPQSSALTNQCEELFKDALGIEIGGKTPLFEEHSILPIYQLPKNLDNCNFSNNTTWEGNISVESLDKLDKFLCFDNVCVGNK